jgi:probable phosphoglycerate mutase
MIFYLIRHGDPIYDPDSLTPLGHEQAAALSKRLSLYGLDEIYASTSIRAQMTAEPTCKALGKEIQLCDWANEAYAFQDLGIRRADGSWGWCFHSSEFVEKFNDPALLAKGKDWYKDPFFKDTTLEKGIERMNRAADEFFRSLGYEHDRKTGSYKVLFENKKRVALFAHQGFGLLFLSSVLDIPYPLTCTRFDLGLSSVTVIAFGDEGKVYPKMLQMSNDSHLYKENILTGYNRGIDI